MKEILLILTVISIPIFLCIYCGYKLFIIPGYPAHIRYIGWSILIFFLMMTPLSVVFRNSGLENSLTDFISLMGYTGLGFISILIIFLLIADISIISGRLISSILNLFNFFGTDNASCAFTPERRAFFSSTANHVFLFSTFFLTSYGVCQAKKTPSHEVIRVPIKDLPQSLEELTIIQISDLHVSATVKKNWVRNMVEKINSLSPDIIVFTGDIADGSPDKLDDDVKPLKDLAATYGVFYVTGNHDYYSGINRWMKKINELGFKILVNEHVIIPHKQGNILIGGVTDFRAGHFLKTHHSDPFKAIEGAANADCKILLAHQPRSIYKAANAGFDLQISGHTHGGQYLPWNFFIKLDQPFVKGLHKYKDTHIYVSKGTGYWGPPIRIGVPSEITQIQLTKA